MLVGQRQRHLALTLATPTQGEPLGGQQAFAGGVNDQVENLQGGRAQQIVALRPKYGGLGRSSPLMLKRASPKPVSYPAAVGESAARALWSLTGQCHLVIGFEVGPELRLNAKYLLQADCGVRRDGLLAFDNLFTT